MGLVAKKKSTGELLYIFEFDEPRKEIDKDDIECHLCGGDLIIKSGLVREKHFAHKPCSPCQCDYQKHPESYEHLFFKRLIAQHLGDEYAEYFGIRAIIECPIHEVRRIADVIFDFPSGWRVAHEIQLSKITTHDLEQRTNDYANAGIDVVWWLGKDADTESNRLWVKNHFGECVSIDYKKAQADR